ncbi:DUF4383 domain-containing protein [Plantactinospora sp. B5E13]|uniref:DUF4383 domain-containing protein n=1 Tax=Plantactinospora sp. B5E13 TaxID=3153758 RepID=UPI00325D878B
MSRHSSTATMPRSAKTPISTAAVTVAFVFLALGVLGFIPDVTTNFDDLEMAARNSEAHLFGVFRVSMLHNLIHLATGVVGLALARTATGSRVFLVGGGAVYLVLWVYGLAIDQDSTANFIPVNSADNWLHLGLGVAMIGLSLVTGRRRPRS